MLRICNVFIIWFFWFLSPLCRSQKITINLASYYPYVICPADANEQVKGIDIRIMTKVFSSINWKENIDYEFNCLPENSTLIGENEGYLFVNNLDEGMFFNSVFVSQPFNFHGLYCLKLERFKNVFTYANSYYFFIFLGVMPMLIGILNKLILPNSLTTEIIWNAYALVFCVKDNFLAKKRYLIYILQSFLVFFTISIYISILTLNKLEKKESFDDMVLYYNGSDNNYVSSNKIHSIFFLNTSQTVEEIYQEMNGQPEHYIFIMDSVKAEILTRMSADIKLIKKYEFLFTHNLLFNNSVDSNMFRKLDQGILSMLKENVNYQETSNFLQEMKINEVNSIESRNDNDLEFFEPYLLLYACIIATLFCFECLHRVIFKKYTLITDIRNYTNPAYIRKSKNNELKTSLTESFRKITKESTFYLSEIIPFFIYRFKKTDKYKTIHRDTLTHHHFQVLRSIDSPLLSKAQKYIRDLVEKGYFKNERNRKRFEKKRRFINENLIKKFKNNLMVSFGNHHSKLKLPPQLKKTLFQIIVSNIEKVDKNKLHRSDSSSPKKIESVEKVVSKVFDKTDLIKLKLTKPKRGSTRISRKKYEVPSSPKNEAIEDSFVPVSEKNIGFTFNVPYIAQIRKKPEFQSGRKEKEENRKFLEEE